MSLEEGNIIWKWLVGTKWVASYQGLWWQCRLHFDYGIQVEGNKRSWRRLGQGKAQRPEAVLSKSRLLGVGDSWGGHRKVWTGKTYSCSGFGRGAWVCGWGEKAIRWVGQEQSLNWEKHPSFRFKKISEKHEYKIEWGELIKLLPWVALRVKLHWSSS